MATAYSDDLEHLHDELAWLDMNIELAVRRLRSRRRDGGLYVSDQAVDEAIAAGAEPIPSLTSGEAELLQRIDNRRDAIAARVAATIEAGIALRLPRVVSLFGLSRFETDALVICLAPELDAKYERLFAYLNDDATRTAATVDLVLTVLCRAPHERLAARRAFGPSARLLRYSLLQLSDDASTRSLLGRSVKLDEGIAHYVLGTNDVDPRLVSCCRLIPPDAAAAESDAALALRAPFTRYLAEPSSRRWVALFAGEDRSRQTETVHRLCSASNVPVLHVDLDAMVAGDTPLARIVPLVFREAALKTAAAYLEPLQALAADGDRGDPRLHTLTQALEEFGWVTFLGARHVVDLGDAVKQQIFFTIEFPLPAYPERKRIWHEYLDNGTSKDDARCASALAARFRFTRREIRNAVMMARTHASLRGAEWDVTQADLEAACRAESNSRLVGFARKIETTYAWSDLVLPDFQRDQLREIIDYVRNHEAVYSEWGFSRKHTLGKGVNLLFSGPSGTGKTMAAGVIASELGLDCYKIDLSTVVSKYIGETEKNLNRIFLEAETSNAVLFFDEADALFGRRTEVKDSHDRYANIEVNYLLQKMEEHEGIVILATNLSKNVDDSFLRRVHFAVTFPMPEREQRLAVWNRVFPSEAPLGADVDREFLARRLKITGGNIKNIAVGAAFLARREDSCITMRHVVLSARREFQKMGKLTTKAEFGDYFEITA